MALSPDTLTLNPMLRALAAQGLGDEAILRELAGDPKRGNRPLLFHLVDKGAVKAPALMAYLSHRYNVPMLDLEAVQIDDTVVAKVDRQLMARHQVLPLSRHRDMLYLAVADPTDFKAIEEVKFNTGLQVTPILVEADKLSKAVANFTSSMQGKLEDLFVDDGKKPGESDEFDLGSDAEGVEDAPVVRFVQQLLLDAIQKGVSDIHLEPYERDIRVRYRLDGVLQDVLHPPIA
ncbi:MAG: ATPase, T2SS/T4P/T4SS family, partial [Acidithiobacillus sp.]